MAEIVVVSWRDIPAQVIVRSGRKSARRELPARFQEAIDRAAMRANLKDSDAYLGEWRRTPFGECSDELDSEATIAATKIDAQFPPERLRALVANGGLEAPPEGS